MDATEEEKDNLTPIDAEIKTVWIPRRASAPALPLPDPAEVARLEAAAREKLARKRGVGSMRARFEEVQGETELQRKLRMVRTHTLAGWGGAER